jgi:hypothetical protein
LAKTAENWYYNIDPRLRKGQTYLPRILAEWIKSFAHTIFIHNVLLSIDGSLSFRKILT